MILGMKDLKMSPGSHIVRLWHTPSWAPRLRIENINTCWKWCKNTPYQDNAEWCGRLPPGEGFEGNLTSSCGSLRLWKDGTQAEGSQDAGPIVQCNYGMKEEWCPQKHHQRPPVQGATHPPHASGSPSSSHVTHAPKTAPSSSNKYLFWAYSEPPSTVPALTELAKKTDTAEEH